MYEKECRVCLSHWKTSKIMIDLFDELNGHLKRQIHSITGIQLREISGQPRYICNNCLMDLESAIKFRQRCIMSEKQLIAAINSEEAFSKPSEKCNRINNDSNDDLIEEVHEEAYELLFETTQDEDTKYSELNGGNANEVSSKTFGPYNSAACSRSINDLCNFQEHTNQHTDIKNFVCKFCRKCFATKRELNAHVSQHTCGRSYACSYCPNTFEDLSILRQHERRHINSRPFECTECGEHFISSSCLSKHRLIHKALPRSHHCNICDVWFHRAGHLQAHKNSRSHRLKAHAAKLASMLS